jgi:small subunit ribosomal protein S3
MGQKVNPHGFRVGVIKDWNSRWFTKDENFGDTLVSDYKVRTYLKEKYKEAGVPKIEIERDNARVRVFLHCAKPGLVIGRGGAEIEKIRLELEAMVGMPVSVNVVEVKNPDVNAQLVAESIAKQLEGRASFRRAMKMSIQRTMKLGAKGIKVTCSGRLAGAEIARTEHYHEGSIPLQTLRADIDYGFAEANTTYGKIGVKVWIYKGEVLRDSGKKTRFAEAKIEAPKQERRGDRRDRRPGNRQGGFNKDRQGGNRNFGGNRQGGFNNRQGGYNNNRQSAPAPKEGGDK